MASTTQQQLPGRTPKVYWLPVNKPLERKLEGRRKIREAIEVCQQVSENPVLSEFDEIQILQYWHVSPSDPKLHITALVKTAAQKESKKHLVMHVYDNEFFCIFDGERGDKTYDTQRRRRRRRRVRAGTTRTT